MSKKAKFENPLVKVEECSKWIYVVHNDTMEESFPGRPHGNIRLLNMYFASLMKASFKVTIGNSTFYWVNNAHWERVGRTKKPFGTLTHEKTGLRVPLFQSKSVFLSRLALYYFICEALEVFRKDEKYSAHYDTLIEGVDKSLVTRHFQLMQGLNEIRTGGIAPLIPILI